MRSPLRVRVATIVAILIFWEALARSGLLYNDVVPPLATVVGALISLLSGGEVYVHLGWTAFEAGIALLIGAVTGIAAGIAFGANRFLQRSYEPYLYYLGATPKLIFFPIMIMWFGIGPSSKIALAAITCFFPIALSTLNGMQEIAQVYIRVGKSFRASTGQMIAKVYIPAIRRAVLTGIKLGFALALVVTLLAETKIANRGLGYLVIQAFNIFDMPRMYALLITVFVFAVGANAVLGSAGRDMSRNALS
jgi:NitT/TauT family transport system permease protein